MLRVHVIAVGLMRGAAERDLVDGYADRCRRTGRSVGFEGPFMREMPESKARTVPERKAQEAAALIAALPDGAVSIRLDERGDMPSSVAFADLIRELRDAGQRDLVFLIGGPDGLGEDIAARAPRALSFGRMTMPHLIMRVLIVEQLYRAVTLLSGHPYHRP
jgi:23S rRNA (pseudouridine1915-N3)-methyltransferase